MEEWNETIVFVFFIPLHIINPTNINQMRKLLLLLIVLLPFIGIGQTAELEKKSLTQRFQNGDFGQETYVIYATEWKKLMAEFGGYPELPVNEETGEIEFIFIEQFSDSITKEVIFNRILEWSAINFGDIKDVLRYKNIENGKIIIKGMFVVSHLKDYTFLFWEGKYPVVKRCYETYIFTIKDSKLKIEITNLVYKYNSGGYTAGNTYVPINVVEIPIKYYYPITDAKPKLWSDHLDLLYRTKLKTDNLAKSLEQYIGNNANDYNF